MLPWCFDIFTQPGKTAYITPPAPINVHFRVDRQTQPRTLHAVTVCPAIWCHVIGLKYLLQELRVEATKPTWGAYGNFAILLSSPFSFFESFFGVLFEYSDPALFYSVCSQRRRTLRLEMIRLLKNVIADIVGPSVESRQWSGSGLDGLSLSRDAKSSDGGSVQY